MSGSGAEIVDALATRFVEQFPADAARVVERLPASQVAELLTELDAKLGGALLGRIERSAARRVVAELPASQVARLLEPLSVPVAALLLRAEPRGRLQEVMSELNAPFAAAVRRSLRHQPGSVGALAEPVVPTATPDETAGRVVSQLRQHGGGGAVVYVVDRDGRFVGALELASLLAAPAEATLDETLSAAADASVVPLRAAESIGRAVHSPAWLSHRALPVVERQLFVGAVTLRALHRALGTEPATGHNALELPIELAELFWLGLAGVTDGLARSVARQVASVPGDDQRTGLGAGRRR